MATSERYAGRERVHNGNPLYKKILENRGLTRVLHYTTPAFAYPTVSDMQTLQMVSHMWTVGDRYWKLAEKSYGDAELWWVIAWFNQRPTEAFIRYGDVIQIPHPIERMFQLYGL